MSKSDALKSLKARYPREFRLDDGTPVRLRPVCPQDKDELQDIMLHLSYESRYSRFLSSVTQLSPDMLRYLTEIDYDSHFALCAVTTGPKPQIVGVARFIRFPDEPHVAEPAFTVVDDYQGRGLGKLMLEQLMLEARRHEVTHFRATLLDANGPMKHLFMTHGAHVTTEGSGVDTAEFALPEIEWTAPPTAPAHAPRRAA